jgi:secreted trypsin-like serine protease
VNTFRIAILFAALAMQLEAAQAAPPFTLEVTNEHTVGLSAFGAAPTRERSTSPLTRSLGGQERSECRDHGRRSAATGSTDAQVLSRTEDALSLTLSVDSSASGGHYRTCGTCVQSNCIGVMGNDTRATASTTVASTVAIRFAADAPPSKYLLDVGAASQGRRPTVTVRSASGELVETVDKSSLTWLLPGRPGAVFYVGTVLDASSGNEGGCCSDTSTAAARVDLRVRKAPLLLSNGRDEPFIVGGIETKSHSNVGAILIDGRLHCTGSVIGNRTILTAAHCLQGYESQLDKFSFLVGSNLLQPTFGPVKVTRFVYPVGQPAGFKFNPATLEDDIGLVYVEGALDIKPVSLHSGTPTWTSINANSTSLVFVGYGYDVIENQLVGAGIKREAAWFINAVENRRVRFKVPGKNTCKGDSGGPAFLAGDQRLVQVGITSGGSADCTSGFETRIDAYAAWLAGKVD